MSALETWLTLDLLCDQEMGEEAQISKLMHAAMEK